MTERLARLMHDEVIDLAPPPPDPAALVAHGRRLQRRQRLATGAAVLAVTAVVSTVAGFVGLGGLSGLGDSEGREVGPAGTEQTPPAYGVGSTIWLGEHAATVPDTVHSLHYTSAGVLVRSNAHAGVSDGSGPESLTLVRYDGTTVDLGTIREGVGPATDPTEDVYVLAEARGDDFVAVVRWAETGEVAQEVPLPDLPPSYWEVPPLALDGETLYAGYKDESVAVDLATGETTPAEGLQGGIPAVHGGRTVYWSIEEEVVSVLDATSGQELWSTDVLGSGSLSPDGEYVQVSTPGASVFGADPGPFEVYHVDSGSSVTIEQPGEGWGWTASGELFRVDADGALTCDPGSGECTTAPRPEALGKNADVRLGGRMYES